MKHLLFCILLLISSCYAQVYVTRRIRVAIHSQLCGINDPGVVSQITDSTDISFSAAFVQDSGLSSAGQLSNYDAVMLSGDGGTSVDQVSQATATALVNWVQSGGGLVITGFTLGQIQDATLKSTLSALSPVQLSQSLSWCEACQSSSTSCTINQFTLTNLTHPMTIGFSSPTYFSDSWCVWSADGLNGGTSISSITTGNPLNNCNGLGTGQSNNQVAVVRRVGSGRVIYLCAPYCGNAFYAPPSLRVPNSFPDRILERALFYAASLPPLCPNGCNNGVCTGANTCSCNAGWSGSSCNVASCTSACLHGGRCVAPDTCNCTGTGYTGTTCQIPSCNPACLNGGTCTGANICSCTAGWNGTACNIPICNPSCQNGGLCTFPNFCDCTNSGASGLLCQNPLCTPPCFNKGVCVSNGTCNCTSGYSGNLCATPICNPPCARGTCVAPNTCDCGTTGYGGALCTQPICNQGCVNGNCTLPNNCTCRVGWNGTDCNTPICSTGCPNGYTCVGPDSCYGTTAEQTTAQQTTAIPFTTHTIWRFTTRAVTTGVDVINPSATEGFLSTTAKQFSLVNGGAGDISGKWIGIAVGIGAGVCILFCCVGFACAAMSKKRQNKKKGIQMNNMGKDDEGTVEVANYD